jgi:translation elongation factor EF-1beta
MSNKKYVIRFLVDGKIVPPDEETNSLEIAKKIKDEWTEIVDKGNGIKENHTANITEIDE